jgi:hypothetical protein
MIYKLNAADEQDDAAFRARLAPLATEVLPRGPAGESPGKAVQGNAVPGKAGLDDEGTDNAPDGEASAASKPAVKDYIGLATQKRGVGGEAPKLGSANGENAARPLAGRSGRRNGVALAGLAGVAALLLTAGSLSRWTGPERQSAPPVAVSPAQRVADSPAQRVADSPEPPVAGSAPAEERPDREPMPRAAPVPVQTPDMIGLLLQRGDAAVADGDIIAARMLFERAAGLGSASAATRAGKTYDIEFLLQSGARGIRGDQNTAAAWYRRAAALGDPEARARLARIEVQPRP